MLDGITDLASFWKCGKPHRRIIYKVMEEDVDRDWNPEFERIYNALRNITLFYTLVFVL